MTWAGGVKRYVTGTNGGPVFVYVKDGRILRITPIDFDENDARPWSIKARGKTFTPPRRTTLSPYSFRLQIHDLFQGPAPCTPMKRVDFDPEGRAQLPYLRGVSGYERISWDEALDIVAGEIKRVKKDHGPGAIMCGSGSHHMWGNLGYWLSTRLRFFNSIGFTPVVHNPDSWEGWYWGAIHHWGNSMRFGATESYGTVEDLLKECEMVVFWSSDPEATSGIYGAFEGTARRQWLKELGIELVHIDPLLQPHRRFLGRESGWLRGRPPATPWPWPSPMSGLPKTLYDKEYVALRTTGFEAMESVYPGGRPTGCPRHRSGRKTSRPFRPRMCAPWLAPGDSRKDLSGGRRHAPVSAVPRVAPPARSGLVPWSALWPCRDWVNPGSTWDACNRERSR